MTHNHTPADANWGVIFDWDGVVVDSSSAHEQSWERLAEENRLHLPADHFLKGFGKTNAFIIPNLLHWTTDVGEIRRLSLRKEALYREILADTGIVVLPGVRELLAALMAAGVPFGVGTSTHRANVELAIGQADLCGFRSITSAEDVAAGKPDPEVFLKAARSLGLLPEKCVVIEDSFSGIEAARRAKMAVVGVATTNPLASLDACDLAVHRLHDVTVDHLHALIETNPAEERRRCG